MPKNTIIGGAFSDFQGGPLANGYLVMELSHDAQQTDTPGEIVAGLKIRVPLDNNGNVAGTVLVWPTDQLLPSGNFYIVNAYRSDGTKAWAYPQNLTVPSSPSPYNIGNWVPTNPPGGFGNGTSGILLQTNGTNNGSQSKFNAVAGSGMTITDDGIGDITFAASGGAPATGTPFASLPISLTQSSLTGNTNGNNKVSLLFLNLPYSITFGHISWFSTTGDDGTCLSDLGLYSVSSPSATTGTLVAHIGPTTGILSSSVNTVAITEGSITLPAGLYLVGFTANTGTSFTVSYAIPSQLGYAWSTSATSSGGTLPNTVSITPHGLVWLPSGGISFFMGAFPAIALS